MERNILWFSHGKQEKEKKWFLFPFNSLSFYTPNNSFLMNTPNSFVGLNAVCANQCHKWVKLPVNHPR